MSGRPCVNQEDIDVVAHFDNGGHIEKVRDFAGDFAKRIQELKCRNNDLQLSLWKKFLDCTEKEAELQKLRRKNNELEKSLRSLQDDLNLRLTEEEMSDSNSWIMSSQEGVF